MDDSIALTVTKADGTKVVIAGTITGATITETAPAPPPATITGVQAAATPSTVSAGATAQCSATVEGTGEFDPAVTWSASAGAISASGVFTAPSAAGPVTITATSVEDASKTGSATIVVQAVTVPPPSGAPVIPANAKLLDLLPDTPDAWKMNHDAGTPGSSTGTTKYPVNAPDGTANCRQFDMALTAHGGEIYHKRIMADATPYRHYCITTEEMSPDWSNVQNKEEDVEQIDAKGNKLDMATQEAGSSNTEEVTGAPKGWTPTAAKGVDPSKLAPNVWHTLKKFFTNNGDGTVTYHGVERDGVYYPVNLTLNDTKPSNWSRNDLNFQYQFDGKSSGTAQTTVYTRKCQAACW